MAVCVGLEDFGVFDQVLDAVRHYDAYVVAPGFDFAGSIGLVANSEQCVFELGLIFFYGFD